MVLFQPPEADQPAPRQATPDRGRPGRPTAAFPTASDSPHKRVTTSAGVSVPAGVSEPAEPVSSTAPDTNGAPTSTAPADRKPSAASRPTAVPNGGNTAPTPAIASGKAGTGRKTAKTTPPRSAAGRAATEGKTATTPGATPARPATAQAKTTPTKKTSAARKATPAKRASPVKKSSPAKKSVIREDPDQRPAEVVIPAARVDGEPHPDEPIDRAPVEMSPAASTRIPDLDLRAITGRILDHPGYAPELLALAAVEVIGPRARDWAEGVRATYPDATPDGLARLATRRFVRLARVGGATAAATGPFAPLVELAAVLWTQAGLVLHLAVAYGRDPSHPDRATELLVLTQVHPDAESAQMALDAARAATGAGGQPWHRMAEAAWRLAAPLAAQAGGWLALRLASRLLPGAAVLAAASGGSAAAQRLTARTVSAYRRLTTS